MHMCIIRVKSTYPNYHPTGQLLALKASIWDPFLVWISWKRQGKDTFHLSCSSFQWFSLLIPSFVLPATQRMVLTFEVNCTYRNTFREITRGLHFLGAERNSLHCFWCWGVQNCLNTTWSVWRSHLLLSTFHQFNISSPTTKLENMWVSSLMLFPSNFS